MRHWLGQDGRVVKRIERMTGTEVVWSKPEPEKTPEPEEEKCPHHPDYPGAGECWFDSCWSCGGYHCSWKCDEE